MTKQGSTKEIDVLNKQCHALAEENKALLSQLHMVQEELERYFHAFRKLEQEQKTPAQLILFDEEFPEILSENRRLKELVQVQKKILEVETRNSLVARLGSLLIESSRSAGKLVTLPVKLRRIWRAAEQSTPPRALGGETFCNVVTAFKEGGREAVEALLDSVFISSSMRANAYTSLARSIREDDPAAAAEIARCAYDTDPQAYRLKWLAFRLYDAGKPLEADAILQVLPHNMVMSDSEIRQADSIRQDALSLSWKESWKQSDFASRRSVAEKQLRDLVQEKELQARVAVEQVQTIKELEETQEKLESRHKRALEVLNETQASLGREYAELSNRFEKQLQLAEERERMLRVLQEANASLEQEKQALSGRYEEQLQLAEERERMLRVLQEANASLEREQQVLSGRYEEQLQLAAERQGELLQSARTQLLLEQEKAALCLRSQELEKQLSTLARDHDEQTCLVAERVAALPVLLEETKTLALEIKHQTDTLRHIRHFLGKGLKLELINAARQIEASVALQRYFATGQLSHIAFGYDSWPVSPDFALYLVECMKHKDYDLILEFGSGFSTVFIAKTILSGLENRPNKEKIDFISFEHLEQYHQQTLALLGEEPGLVDLTTLVLAPLQDVITPNGVFPYYSCQSTLGTLAKKRTLKDLTILAVIDGPPAATGKHARYPAFPLLLESFPGAHIDFLLDDYSRDDEREIVQLWKTESAASGVECLCLEKNLERKACLVRVQSHASKGVVLP